MAAPRPRTRLYCRFPLLADQTVRFDRDQAAYLTKVLRLKTGAEVGLFNEQAGEWRAVLHVEGARTVQAQIGGLVMAPEPATGPTLAFAPIKKAPLEWLLIKATELGVRALQPVITDHTQAKLERPERLRLLLQEAAEQTERCRLPELHEPMALAPWLEQAGPVLVAAEAGQAVGPKALLLTKGPPPQTLLIGPEGGFSPAELADFATREAVTCLSLGPQILKAETAGLALLTLAQLAHNHFEQHPAFRP